MVTWSGTAVFSESNPADQGGPYANFSVSVVGAGSDTLVFTSVNNPGFTYLDDVSLAAVPEPTAVVLLCTLLLALALVAKKAAGVRHVN
jgi:hypothetical protein